MTRIAIVGCGIIGATLAYELSRHSHLDIHVIDQGNPAQGSTQAALGVLMGIISHKIKGRNWRLRRDSIERYKTLIPELEATLGYPIPHIQGLLSLCFDPEQIPRWQSLQAKRATQGYPLEIWSPDQLRQRCPQIDAQTISAAIYSPQDGQVHPQQLTLALVEAAQRRGVTPHWQSPVLGLNKRSGCCSQLQLPEETLDVDWVILSAGLDSADLSQLGTEPLPMIPVLGQAMEIELDQPLGQDDFQPVISGYDVHLVSLGQNRYWLGATVEFPPGGEAVELPLDVELVPDPERLEQMRQLAIRYCPAIAEAQIVRQWSGLRPRPQGQGAPVIKPLAGYENVILATGHYRNGVLLAPGTAMTVAELLGLTTTVEDTVEAAENP
ncbi:FAD-binding oxidoreductase [Leptolyngbya cf. ectocarpi LEGE 11479]|uniref:FAD-binding oxidoreductase n=1 Tax=Leptolyngbya cf. ectocarpi LEGE 11479 TaxID=1828722 RepID=A0A929FBK5_LEPEC|nr:FAD-dependent oxidoreductase [Leptolyngbya ectocarpi]MBE9069084.1 FAD-binding oxidoreductase [Leptolyngbya cf. ectocarpi LEGE 11479]